MSPKIACPRGCIVTLVAFVWLFSSVHFQMCPQTACIKGCIVALIAFVCLFSTVCFQMFPQSTGMMRCKVALVAFVCLFSNVCFQMSPQNTCMRWCIVTLVAFVWLFSAVRFQMCPQITCLRGCIVTLIAFVWLFSFIICVSHCNISVEPTYTTVIIFKIMIHHNQTKVGNIVVLPQKPFLTKKGLRIIRENKWKWEWLLKTIWKATRSSTFRPDRNRQWKQQPNSMENKLKKREAIQKEDVTSLISSS